MSEQTPAVAETAFLLWQRGLRDHENECPWPGPRPLRLARDRTHFWRFVGRKAEIRTFLRNLDDHVLLVMHGNSGAGKTSLLEMGLITVMRQRGYVPIVCREWEDVGDDPDGYLKRALQPKAGDNEDMQLRLPQVVHESLLTSDDPVAVLDAAFKGKAVLVFDQFEELIRYQPEEFKVFRTWLLKTLRTRRTKVVLSLRSEYVYELADLLAEVRPFDAVHQQLAPMTSDDEIKAIISGPNTGGPEVITSKAADLVFEVWKGLSKDSPYRSLLYLHALMFSLYWRSSDGRVDLGVVQKAIDETTGSYDDVLAAGFDRAIERKLLMCRESYEDLELPRRTVLPTAVTEQIRLLVPQLSSGGYKLERDLLDLFRVACEREIALLCYREPDEPDLKRGRLSVNEALEVVAWALQPHRPIDILTLDRTEILVMAKVPVPGVSEDEETVILAGLGVSPVPWRNDVLDVSSGALCGFAPWEVMVEQIRAFVFAVAWLRQTSLVRVASPRKKSMAQLVHDGMGIALKHWSDHLGFAPETAAYSLCAFEGERWDWREERTGFFGRESSVGPTWTRYLVNLRWRYCQISAWFTRVVFVNCDLRGTRFQKSRFEGVTFVNCLLDGAVFEDCVVVGSAPSHNPKTPPDQREGADADALPQFVIAGVSASLVAEWDSYRGTDSPSGAKLYSPTSGVAAIPWNKPVDTVDFEPHVGGLSMYGGRLSSLMVSRCDFDDGSMTLANVAGSSLDIVETEVLNLTLSWSAIRGVSVTRRPGQGPVGPDEKGIRVDADECVLYSTWFGTELQGQVTMRQCQVFSITNLSGGVDVELLNSKVSQDLGVNSEVKPIAGVDMKPLLASNAPRTTYRSVPARVELERRVARAKVADQA